MVTSSKVHKCIICESRPAVTDSGYCHNCAQKITADERNRKAPKPDKYLTYRGGVVGLFEDKDDKYRCEALTISAKRLPKTKTVNLNRYCEGYTRQQIKAFKRAVLSLALVTG